jgi:hypothetical protein
VALFGLGGSGKTELALRFAEKNRHAYAAVFWINGVDESHVTDGLVSIYRALNLGDATDFKISIREAQRWLSTHQDWLMIIDNMDDDTMIDLVPRYYINAGMKGSILFTSRNERVATRWNSIEISNMEPREAASLLRNITGSQIADDGPVTELLRALGHLPLAIDQAASFIFETGITVSKYYDLFETEKRHLLKKYPSTQYNVERRENVMTTWEISFDHIQRDQSQAAVLLLMFSLLDNQDIPQSMLESASRGHYYWAPNGEFEELPSNESFVPKELSEVLCNYVALLEAVAALKRFSLVRHQTDSASLTIHPLVHFWANQRLSSDESLKKKLKTCIIGLVSSALNKQDRLPPLSHRRHGARGLEDSTMTIWPWRRYTQLAPHALRCLKYAEDAREMPESVAHLSLALLQVLEYSTFGKFKVDHDFAISLIHHLESFSKTKFDYLALSALMWLLSRGEMCPCRKYISTADLENKQRDLCVECQRTYERASLFEIPCKTDIRILCVSQYLLLRLKEDRFWNSPWKARAFESGYLEPPSSDLKRSFSESLKQQWSWMEKYALTMRYYLRMRSDCENDKGPHELWRFRRNYGADNVVSEYFAITESFQELCGKDSEEYRRSAFYASSILVFTARWSQVQQFLFPLVASTLQSPSQSWSHERCIIRYTEALLKQGKYEEAKHMVSQLEQSYCKSGLHLVSINRSPLIFNHVCTYDKARKPLI